MKGKQPKRTGKRSGQPVKLDRSAFHAFDSFEAADEYDRAYWWSRSPAERMRELERLRRLNYGYGEGRPLPRFQRVLRVAELGGS